MLNRLSKGVYKEIYNLEDDWEQELDKKEKEREAELERSGKEKAFEEDYESD